jgi:hypothetical protein
MSRGVGSRSCAHCGKVGETYGQLNNSPLCHPNVGMDCYRLVTVYHEPIGARLPGRELDGKPRPIRDNSFPFDGFFGRHWEPPWK